MKLSACVVSVQYGDYLAATLGHNRSQFDEMVVVTDNTDEETDKICEFYHVKCVKTDSFYDDGASFNKAKGINVGLDALYSPEWVIHMDGDIVLPPRARDILEHKTLDDEAIYGVDRFMVQSYRQWTEFLAKPRLQHECDTFLHIDSFPIGVRIVKPDYSGYVPIGFFQLWYDGGKKVRYPDGHTDAARTDMLFSLGFPPAKRVILGDFLVYHLATEDQKMSCNWSGRRSKRFAPQERQLTVLRTTRS